MRKTCYNHAMTIHLTTRKDIAFFGGEWGRRGVESFSVCLVGWLVGWFDAGL